MPDLNDPIAQFIERLDLKASSAHTLRAYAADLRQAEKAVGDLLTVTPDKLEAYANGLARRIKPTSVRRKHASLRSFYAFCRKAKLRADDPTVGFEAPKLEERLPIYLNDQQVEAALAVLRGDTLADRREAAIFSAFYYTGMRACELGRLDVEDLMLDQKQLRVFGKGKRERLLPISSQLGARLWAWLDVHPAGRTGPLFVTLAHPHGRMSYDAIAAVVKGALARAGLAGKKFSCHKLRHTFATRLINRKTPIDRIQKMLGHRRIDTTTIYAHTNVGADALDDVNRAL